MTDDTDEPHDQYRTDGGHSDAVEPTNPDPQPMTGVQTTVPQDLVTDDTFVTQFEMTVGTVVVEDKHSGEHLHQWKAIAENEAGERLQRVSDSPMDAVLGVIEEATGGVI